MRVVAVATADPDLPVRLVVDTRRRLPGRGAWVHPDRACVESALRRRVFARALRVPGPLDPDELLRRFAPADPIPDVVTSTVREQVHER